MIVDQPCPHHWHASTRHITTQERAAYTNTTFVTLIDPAYSRALRTCLRPIFSKLRTSHRENYSLQAYQGRLLDSRHQHLHSMAETERWSDLTAISTLFDCISHLYNDQERTSASNMSCADVLSPGLLHNVCLDMSTFSVRTA